MTPRTMSIHEAFAELRVLKAKREQKRQFVQRFAFRIKAHADPLERVGGAEKTVREEMQAIADLDAREISIREQIAKVNDVVLITIGTQTKSLAAWLLIRRHTGPARKAFLDGLATLITTSRTQMQSKRVTEAAKEAGNPEALDLVLHLDELALQRMREDEEAVLNELDGKITLANATTMITI